MIHFNTILLICITFLTAQASIGHRLLNKFYEQDTHQKTKINNAQYIFACHELKCQKIKEFSLAKNITHTCFDEFLAIEFEVSDVTEKKISTFGYLPSQKGSTLSNSQQVSSICRKIKRYSKKPL